MGDNAPADDLNPVHPQRCSRRPTRNITGTKIETGVVFRAFDHATQHRPVIEGHRGVGTHSIDQRHTLAVSNQEQRLSPKVDPSTIPGCH